MVDLRCRERSSPCCLASAIWAAKNSRSAFTCMTAVSMISPSTSAIFFLRIVTAPLAATNSYRTSIGFETVVEFSEP